MLIYIIKKMNVNNWTV